MGNTPTRILTALLTSSFLLASSVSFAKQVEIGVGAIAVDTSLIGKGTFKANDTVDEGDSIKTEEKGTTTVLFNDESMLTLGPNAHATIEVYEEGKNGKPGRSIIRVHKGQFRYFPGGILENGGSQFVAVGNKLLGKAAIRQPDLPASANEQQRQDSGQNPLAYGDGISGNGTSTHPQQSEQIEEANAGSAAEEGSNPGVIFGPPPPGSGSAHAIAMGAGKFIGGSNDGGSSSGGHSPDGFSGRLAFLQKGIQGVVSINGVKHLTGAADIFTTDTTGKNGLSTDSGKNGLFKLDSNTKIKKVGSITSASDKAGYAAITPGTGKLRLLGLKESEELEQFGQIDLIKTSELVQVLPLPALVEVTPAPEPPPVGGPRVR